jgi:hypothetical protein
MEKAKLYLLRQCSYSAAVLTHSTKIVFLNRTSVLSYFCRPKF